MKFLKRITNISIILLAVGVIFELIALLVYYATGINEFNDTLSSECLGFSYATLIFGVVLILIHLIGVDEMKFSKGTYDIFLVCDYLLGLGALMYFITSKVNYLANIFVSIDGTTIDPSFVITITCFLAASVLILVSSFLTNKMNKVDAIEVFENE